MLAEIRQRLTRTLGRKPTSEEVRTEDYLSRPLDHWREMNEFGWRQRLREAKLEPITIRHGDRT